MGYESIRLARGSGVPLRVVAEGLEDVSLELDSGWLHLQVKSCRGHRGDFSPADLRQGHRQD